MSPAAITMFALAGATYVLKSAGPLALGAARRLPPLLDRSAALLPAALLAALVATSTIVSDEAIVVDARLVGLGAAAVALWRRAPFVVVVVLAAAATAAVRVLA